MKRSETLKQAFSLFEMPQYEQIPDVGLYLEQVAKFINGFLTDFPQMNVTTSMISNYAKQKLIDRVNKKTYTRDQIAALIMIAFAKTVIPIDYVRIMLELVREEDGSMKEAYSSFRERLLGVLGSLAEEQPLKTADSGNETEQLMQNIVITIAHKMYLERSFILLQEAQD